MPSVLDQMQAEELTHYRTIQSSNKNFAMRIELNRLSLSIKKKDARSLNLTAFPQSVVVPTTEFRMALRTLPMEELEATRRFTSVPLCNWKIRHPSKITG